MLEILSHLLFQQGQGQMNVYTEQTDQMPQVHNHFVFSVKVVLKIVAISSSGDPRRLLAEASATWRQLTTIFLTISQLATRC